MSLCQEPAAVASGIHPHIQANFAANLLEVKSTDQAKDDSSNLFAHLEPFNEEEEQLGSLGGEANS